MKKIFLLIYIVCSIQFVYSQSGWFRQNSGTTQDLWSVLFLNPDTGFVIGYNSTILKTTNGGLNWISKNAGVQSNLFSALCFTNTNTGFVSGYDGEIVKTTDGGETWNLYPQNMGCVFSFFFINQSTGFGAGRHNNIIKSTDTGNNWEHLPRVYNDTNFTSIYFINENTGFLTCEQGSIYRTTDNGNTWISQHPVSNSALWSITFINPNTGFAAGLMNNYYSALILKTTNSGQNWNIIVSGVGNNVNCIKFNDSQNGFTAGSYGSIYFTTNGGHNWDNQSSGTNLELNSIFFVNNLIGYVVGDSGTILKTTTGGVPIGIKPISNSVPDKFILYQNYPNPFNPTTKIKFSIPPSPSKMERGQGGEVVRLAIFDILGREVTTLINENLQPGTYEIEWNASNNASGVYFYQLRAGDFTKTKKLVLLK